MSEREKTLKEKASDLEVELARVYDELRSRYSYDAARVVSQARLFIHERTKALTALEKRVEELEGNAVCSCGNIIWSCSVCTEARSFVEEAPDGD